MHSMNIEAKPWYPTALDVQSTMAAAAETVIVRRHDPYSNSHTVDTLASPVSNHHEQFPTRYEGVFDYTTDVFGDEPLPDSPLPSYNEFVQVTGSTTTTTATAAGGPYRSGGPYRTGDQCTTSQLDYDSQRHGSGCGVSACDSNESSGTPRGTAAAAATTVAKAPKEPPKPVTIPLPRSRRPPTGESPTSSTPQSPVPESPTSAQQDTTEFPITKEPLRWAAMDDEECDAATASATATAPSSAGSHTLAALNEETNLFIRKALLSMARANPSIQIHHQQHRDGTLPPPPPPPQQQLQSPVKATAPVRPMPKVQQQQPTATVQQPKQLRCEEPVTKGPPAVKQDRSAASSPTVAEKKLPIPSSQEKEKEKKKPKRNTEDAWHVVTSNSKHHHPTAATSTTTKSATAASSSNVTHTATGFEALCKGEKRRSKKHADSDDDDNAESHNQQHAIIMAAPEGKKKKRKVAQEDDDELLEAASKQTVTASRDAEEKAKLTARVQAAPFALFSAVTMNAVPTYGALLPADPTPAMVHLLVAFNKAKETDAESHHARSFALERCASTVSTMMGQCPLLAAAIFAECCDTFGDVECSNAHATRCLQIGKKHRLLVCELMGQLALCRLLLKLGEAHESRGNLVETLKLSFEIKEENAVGWVMHTIGTATELFGNLADTLYWYRLALAIGKRLNDLNLQAHASSSMALLAASVGHTATARRLLAETVQLLESFPATTYQLQPCWQNMSQAYTQMGDLHAAMPYYLKEREWFAKDSMLSATATQNMIVLHRGMGSHSAAVSLIQELLQGDTSPRELDLLLSLASCYRDLQNTTRSKETLQRVLRGARVTREATGQIVRSLVELADLSRVEGATNDALTRLVEAVRVQDTLSAAERRHLCECEWRLLEVLEDTLIDRSPLDALRCSDPMRYPNTADAEGLLRRRQYKALPETLRAKANSPTATTAPAKKKQQQLDRVMEDMFNAKFFDKSLFHSMMQERGRGDGFDTMVVYSLRWNDGVTFYAYVVQAGPNYNETVTVRKLQLTPEAQVVLCTESALMQKLHPASFDNRDPQRMIPFDTPLFPQRHTYDVFELGQTQPSLCEALQTDLTLSLATLYDCFVRPLEDVLPPAGSTLLFVGDGIVQCLPFHALFSKETNQYLVEKYHVAKVPSVQHALTIYSRRCAIAAENNTSASAVAAPRVSFVTAAPNDDEVRRMLEGNVEGLTVTALVDGETKPHQPPADSCCPSVDDAEKSSVLGKGHDLLARLIAAPSRNIALSNHLFRAVHMEADHSAPLLLDVGQLSDLKEDFSGMLCTLVSQEQLATSAEVAATWDLGLFPLVVCTRFGSFGTRALHETSIPIYRSLMLAGAQRLLLPCGNRARITEPDTSAAALQILRAVLAAPYDGAVKALSATMQSELKLGRSVDEWGFSFALHGLP